METETWDAVVVGGGAAGLSAALLLGRSRRRIVVIDAGAPRNRFAGHMHGVLGHEGLPPDELLHRGRAEVAGYGVVVHEGTAERVDETTDGVLVTLTDGDVLAARALVVASGVVDELPDVPGLAQRWGTSVLHCPYCHGWEVADQRLGVLTTSPMSLHQAELVRQWSADVVVFTAGAGELPVEQEHRLRSRGLRLVDSPVVEVLGDGDHLTAVRCADGEVVTLDAIFTAGTPRPDDAFLTGLGLERTDTPFGSFLAVDQTGQTSHNRIWAVGNVTQPTANVPMVIGAGALAGAMVNAVLVAAEFDAATAIAEPWPEVAPAEYWERRYGDQDRMWSGRVNAALADVAAQLEPGTALDLGCGEGGDVLWLAGQGWTATGIDISTTAIDRARATAQQAGIGEDRARFFAAELGDLPDEDRFDLVTASFFHSPVALPRSDILRSAAGRVSTGGHLLVTSHAAAPPWASAHDGHEHRFLSPAEEIDALDLDPEAWHTILAEVRTRTATAPDGDSVTLDDVVVLLRRR